MAPDFNVLYQKCKISTSVTHLFVPFLLCMMGMVFTYTEGESFYGDGCKEYRKQLLINAINKNLR